MTKRSKYCLIGIPDDQGVQNVGGRLGASKGPKAFRESFFSLKSRIAIQDLVIDGGDAPIDKLSIKETHFRVINFIQKAHEMHHRTMIIGGGHDHGYTHLVGVKKALEQNRKEIRLGCINIDAHLDVRPATPEITSGSPFYLALEDQTVLGEDLIEFGIQPHCNQKDLFDYVNRHNVKVFELKDLRGERYLKAFKKCLSTLHKKCSAIVVQLDLDAIAMAHAPGVSAPQPDGFFPDQIIEIMRLCRQDPKVVSLGFFELNPVHDRDQATAKIAAVSAYSFLELA